MKKKFNKKEWTINYREKNKERLREYRKKYEQTEKRKEYMKSEKKKKYYKERYEKKKEEIREKRRKYYLENKDRINKTTKEYYIQNKDKVKKTNKEYREKRISSDPIFKLSIRTRSLILNSISRNGYTKKSKTYQILGCSFEEFKQHLECQFEPWMNWDNYGKYNGELNFGWDIDHVIPQSSAKTEDELLLLNHYTNLKPLCSKINRDIKRNTV